MPTQPGLFIVFEGGEGSGKTTQVLRLAETMRDAGHNVTTSREPGGTPIGAVIRELLLSDWGDAGIPPRAETLLFLADRAAHVAQVIRPALARGEIVISDRYGDSTSAYQGAGRELGAFTIRDMSRWATDRLEPDLVFVLDIDPAEGLVRAGRRSAPDRLEGEDLAFHQRVRRHFQRQAELAENHRQHLGTLPRYELVDASRPVDEVAARVRQVVREVLTARAGGLAEAGR